MKDIKFDIENGVSLTSNDFSLVDKKERILQHCKTAHYIFTGDWFLDYTVGINHFDNLKAGNNDKEEAEIRNAISNVNGVDRLISLTYENKNNKIKIEEVISIDEKPYTITEGLAI